MENGPSGNDYLFPITVVQHMIDYMAIEQNNNRNNPFLSPSRTLVADEMDS